MSFLITLIAFFVIFSVLILVHEFGHFYMAKRHGIKVEEFGFGLPPRLWGVKRGETIYSINWIPFGGFVRMLGEDARDGKGVKSPRSFAKKSLWQRTQVVCAGVVMNFLLAWVLLSAGFMVGMQPLMVDSNDFLEQIKSGQIEIASGVVVDQVVEGSWAEEAGFFPGMEITRFNGAPIEDLADFYAQVASGEGFSLNEQVFEPTDSVPQAGLSFNVFELPRVIVDEVGEEGIPLQSGDVVESVNGETVFYADEFFSALRSTPTEVVELMIEREGESFQVQWWLQHPPRVVIEAVLPDSPAQEGGLQAGDLVVNIDSQSVWTAEQAVEIITASESPTVIYDVQRGEETLSFILTKNEEGLVGVLLSNRESTRDFDLTYHDGLQIVSITEVHPVTLPWHEAPLEALEEIKRLSGYTAVMIAQVFGQIFTSGEVPEGVAGPVGIAQMTHLYVQEGFVALMRFTALLSLSLAVINIFPFPALDGGRFLFILIEAVRGKPVDTRLEGVIHTVGFVLLMVVLFLVTFQDLTRLFS